MKSLCIETSRQDPTLTLFDHSTHKTLGAKTLSSQNLAHGRKHSTSLVSEIKKMLTEFALPKEELSYIGVSLGPGSFIGTRSGIITAKTLAYALGIKIAYFCSLEIYAPEAEGAFICLSDAKSSGVYALFGEKKNGEVFFEQKPQLLSIDDLLRNLGKKTLLISPEAEIIKAKIPKALNVSVKNSEIDYVLFEKMICQKSRFDPLVTNEANEPLMLRIS